MFGSSAAIFLATWINDSGSYHAASVGVLITFAPSPVRTSDFS
jgi:hypothetical protein